MLKDRKFWLPVLIVLAGAFLRFYGLDFQSLWNDELSSWRMTRYPSFQEVLEKGVKTDGHPPGYHLILWGVQKTAGDSPWALRFPSALAGSLTVWLMLLLGAALFNRRHGLFSAMLMAVAWCPVYFSQEARSYALLLMLAVLSYLITWKISQGIADKKRVRGQLWLAEGAVLAGLCYLHYFGVFLAGLQLLWLFAIAAGRGAIKQVAFLAFAVALLYLPWLWQIPAQMKAGPKWIEPAGTSFFGYYLGFIFNKSALVLGGGLFLMAPAVWQGVKSSVEFFRSRCPAAELYLLFLLVAPYLAGLLVSYLMQPVLSWRNLLISLPAAYLLVVRGWHLLPLPSKWQWPAWGAVILALLLHLSVGMKYYTTPQKEQFKEAAEFIMNNDNLAPGAPLYGYAWYPEYLEYYFLQAKRPRPVKMLAGDENQFKQLREMVEKDRAEYFWYFWGHRQPEEHFIHLLHMNYENIGYQKFNGAGVYLFRKTE